MTMYTHVLSADGRVCEDQPRSVDYGTRVSVGVSSYLPLLGVPHDDLATLCIVLGNPHCCNILRSLGGEGRGGEGSGREDKNAIRHRW